MSELGLTGATAGQFRVLGRWPSGRIKWVQVDTLASFSAGSTATGIAVTSGGAATSAVRISPLTTARRSRLPRAPPRSRSERRTSTGSIRSWSVARRSWPAAHRRASWSPGPHRANDLRRVQHRVSSANDASSTAVIEENGPVRAGRQGNWKPQRRFRQSLHEVHGADALLQEQEPGQGGHHAPQRRQRRVELVRNGLQRPTGYEWRTTAGVGGTQTYDIAKHGGTSRAAR